MINCSCRELRSDVVKILERLQEYVLNYIRTPSDAGAFKYETRAEVRITHLIENRYWPIYFYRFDDI
jgi:hypothetical protein